MARRTAARPEGKSPGGIPLRVEGRPEAGANRKEKRTVVMDGETWRSLSLYAVAHDRDRSDVLAELVRRFCGRFTLYQSKAGDPWPEEHDAA